MASTDEAMQEEVPVEVPEPAPAIEETTEKNYKETADEPRGETRWPVVPQNDVVLHPCEHAGGDRGTIESAR